MLVNIDCPVEYLDYKLYKGKRSGSIFCSLTFHNLSSRMVKGLKIRIYCYDQFGDPISDTNNQLEYKLEVKEGLPPNCKRTAEHKINLSGFPSTRKVEVDIEKILFEDDSLWSKGISKSEQVELVPIENLQLRKYVQSRAGEDAVFLAKSLGDRWICVCGCFNASQALICRRCRRNQESVINDYSSEEVIIREFRSFEAEQAKLRAEAQTRSEQYLALKVQRRKRMTKYSLYAGSALLMIAVLSFALLSNFSFSTDKHESEKPKTTESTDSIKRDQADEGIPSIPPVIIPSPPPTSTAAMKAVTTVQPEVTKPPDTAKKDEGQTAPKSEMEDPDGIITTSFIDGGGSSGIGAIKIEYRSKGRTNSKLIEGFLEPQLMDIDNNGIKELVIPTRMYIPELSNAQMPVWDDVYEFDLGHEELMIVSNRYPEYYKKNYIPSLNKSIAVTDDPMEKQALSSLKKAASDLIAGTFVPDKDHERINVRIEQGTSQNLLHITKKNKKYYVHGVTLGMTINEAIKILGKPYETYEVNSKVAKWRLNDGMVLTAEYYDEIYYIDFGEFNYNMLQHSLRTLGKPAEADPMTEDYSYLTPTQRLRFHQMVEPGIYRVQLMGSDVQ